MSHKKFKTKKSYEIYGMTFDTIKEKLSLL